MLYWGGQTVGWAVNTGCSFSSGPKNQCPIVITTMPGLAWLYSKVFPTTSACTLVVGICITIFDLGFCFDVAWFLTEASPFMYLNLAFASSLHVCGWGSKGHLYSWLFLHWGRREGPQDPDKDLGSIVCEAEAIYNISHGNRHSNMAEPVSATDLRPLVLKTTI